MPKFDPNILPFRQPSNEWRPEPNSGFYEPAVMAIGDSLFNGCRSASIDAKRSSESVPAYVARGLGSKFRHQDYPRAVLINLEDEVSIPDDEVLPLSRLLLRIPEILNSVRKNCRTWVDEILSSESLSKQRYFDNLAITGAEAWDVFNATAGNRRSFISDIRNSILNQDDIFQWGGRRNEEFWNFVTLHMAINIAFSLNPTRDPALENLRSIDLVELRKPKNLIMSLGNNHGVITTTLFGNWKEGIKTLKDFTENTWPACMATLAALSKDIERIAVSLMPLPRHVPNMMPPLPRNGKKPELSDDGYFPVYENYLGGLDDYVQLSAEDMIQIDLQFKSINDRLRKIAETAFSGQLNRLLVVDPNALIEPFDGKHFPERALLIPAAQSGRKRDVRYTNDALDLRWEYSSTIREIQSGGIAGLDNHHLTAAGYMVYANGILRQLDQSELLVTDRDDPVLLDPPDGWIHAMHYYRALRMRRKGMKANITRFSSENGMAAVTSPMEHDLSRLMALVTKVGGGCRPMT